MTDTRVRKQEERKEGTGGGCESSPEKDKTKGSVQKSAGQKGRIWRGGARV